MVELMRFVGKGGAFAVCALLLFACPGTGDDPDVATVPDKVAQTTDSIVDTGPFDALDVAREKDVRDVVGPDSRSETLAIDVSDTINADILKLESVSEIEDNFQANGFGALCQANSDCLSGWCVFNMGEKVCTEACIEECPADWSCQPVPSPDPVSICQSMHPSLCLPCESSAKCELAGGGRCVAYGAMEGFFCGTGCGAGKGCPPGYVCKNSITFEGDDSAQCVAEEGTCNCTKHAILEEMQTQCSVSNEFGTCTDWRICTEQGLSPCNPKQASKEVCDGEDDDCDGQIDEESGCDDGNPCTGDECKDGICFNNPLTGPQCFDEDLCTENEHCNDGECVADPVDCNDANLCTDDSCETAVGCQNVPNNLPCEPDEAPCTADICDGGLCTHLPGNDGGGCKDDEDPCTSDICDGGLCIHPAGNDGTPCNDSDACTTQDQCGNGECVGGPPSEECLGTCGDGKCVYTESADKCPVDCGWCGDGVCGLHENGEKGGLCPKDCLAACGDGKCVGGESLQTCLVDCGGCGDSFCGLNESNETCADDCPPTCGDEECKAGEESYCPVDCTPPCGDGVCQWGENTLLCPVDCTVCEDGVCGKDESPETCPADCATACGNGLCEGGESPGGCAMDCGWCGDDVCGFVETQTSCPADCWEGCGDGKCQAEDGESKETCPWDCSTDPDADEVYGIKDNCPTVFNPQQLDTDQDGHGDVCDFDDDGDTESDATDCMPLDPEISHLANEVCDNIDNDCDDVVDQGELCNDSLDCTLDLCGGEEGCKHSPLDVECDDANECTADTCNELVGCMHQKLFGPCDVDNQCTLTGTCQGAVCTGNEPIDCDDDNPCTDDDCNPSLGCVSVFNTGICDDTDPCTEDDVCLLGECAGHPVSCDDELECTDDLCEQSGICTNPLLPGYCFIASACYADGLPNPDNPCIGCVAELSTDSWSVVDGSECGPLPHASTSVCLDSVCVVEACKFGFADENGKSGDGCEAESNVVWVDAANADDPQPDGSSGHPYPTIKEALVVVPVAGTIYVKAGSYDGGLLVNRPNIGIVGENKDQVTIGSSGSKTGVWITAQNVSLQDLSIKGGACGVHIQGSELSALPGGKLENLAITDLKGYSQSLSGAGGIFVDHVDGLAISGVTVSSVQSSGGGDVTGMLVANATNIAVNDCTISNVKGAYGGSWCMEEPDPMMCEGGSGGDGIGIWLKDCSDCTVTDSDVSSVSGGGGGMGEMGGCGGGGGGGYGILVADSKSFVVSDNQVSTVSGGYGGDDMDGMCMGYPASGTGISVTELGGQLTGNSVADVSGGPGTATIQDAASGANAYGIRIKSLEEPMKVSGNHVSSVKGGAGPDAMDGMAGSGGSAYGISCSVLSMEFPVDEVLVQNNLVESLHGGTGGSSDFGMWGSPGSGGWATGVFVSGGNATIVIEGNQVVWAKGGTGGNASPDEMMMDVGASGGAATGLDISEAAGEIAVARNVFARMAGGTGGDGLAQGGGGGNGGNAIGVRIRKWENGCILSHLSLYSMVGGVGGAGGGDPEFGGMDGQTGWGIGVDVDKTQTQPVSVTDSIVSDTSSYCLRNYYADNVADLTATYGNLWNCGTATMKNATLDGCIGLDPIFMSLDDNDFHIHPASPCVDTGSPSSQCGNEPEPNGCRVNIGAYGNTEEAASAPGAQHCDQCPQQGP